MYASLRTEKLANTERHLDVAKGHSLRAEDRADELKQLNRSIFRPVITFNKDAKRAAQESKIQQRYEDEREEREKAMLDIRETQERVGRAVTYGRSDEADGIAGRYRTEAQLGARKEQRKRFQFDATASDDELEDELDDNLNEISDMTKRLKALGTSMGQELDKQNERIGRITEKTDNLDNRIFRNTKKVCIPSTLTPSFYSPCSVAREDQVDGHWVLHTHPGILRYTGDILSCIHGHTLGLIINTYHKIYGGHSSNSRSRCHLPSKPWHLIDFHTAACLSLFAG